MKVRSSMLGPAVTRGAAVLCTAVAGEHPPRRQVAGDHTGLTSDEIRALAIDPLTPPRGERRHG